MAARRKLCPPIIRQNFGKKRRTRIRLGRNRNTQKCVTQPDFIADSQRDRAWAEHLIDTIASEASNRNGSCKDSETNLDVALNLVSNDAKNAEKFGARSLQSGISPNFITLQQRLRQEDANAADRSFLQVLSQYRLQSNDAYQLTILGTYLFTSPRVESGDSTAFVLTRVGNIGVPDITTNRQNISPVLVRAYLGTALEIMHKPNSDSAQQQSKYALGYLLLPKAREFAPDLVGQIGAAMAAIASTVPSQLTRGKTVEVQSEPIGRKANQRPRKTLFLFCD